MICMFGTLKAERAFCDPKPWDSWVPSRPVIVTQDNGDSTYSGHLDLDKMSLVQKIASL